ncbi:unnamed protein product [Polarella glacialis]|uniref:Uncharacterized protein n=1 Tax=Polarella glacialis TaxID=89957 RepID=A0A813LQP2_POLGL|nr:unnamed protein product [Polarella glacialis]
MVVGALRLLPHLPLAAWQALRGVCRADYAAVSPACKALARQASDPTQSVLSLSAVSARAAAIRLFWLTGIYADDQSMPKLVNSAYNWAHYGKSAECSRRPLHRAAHLKQLSDEFPVARGEKGIQACMRRELAAVEAAIRIRLALGGSLREVDNLSLVPADTPGKLEGRASIACTRDLVLFKVIFNFIIFILLLLVLLLFACFLFQVIP